jgi:hypothetical protein
MDEIKFVVKTFLFSCLLIIFMQVKVGGGSIEGYSYRWLRHSPVSLWIQSAAAGGALAIRNLGSQVKEGLSGTMDDYQKVSPEKASK